MDDDQQWMHEAIALAKYAEEQQEVPVGSVVVFENKIVGKGWNRPISSHDPTAHAEIVALRDAAKTLGNYRLVDSTLYVTLEPCLMCIGAMLHARIKQLVFGAYDPKTGAVGSAFNILDNAIHNHTIEVKGGVLQRESAELLQSFFQARRKK